MGNPKGFMTIGRKEAGYRPLNDRIYDYGEVEQTLDDKDRIDQAARCMDCGVPFCHWGCPVGSKIPEWQDLVYKGKWKEAYEVLHSTNSFPEFTGRVCPAPCEKACVLAIHDEAVTIRENEASTVEHAFNLGFVQPRIPEVRTGKKVAVVGSGPAGLSAADLLNQAGHEVTVFEKNSAIGGLLRFGIPDFKLSKSVIDRRLEIFLDEGIIFRTNVTVGVDITRDELLAQYDAVVLANGAEQPRDLPVEGREMKGVYFAMDFLSQSNKRVAGEIIPEEISIHAKDKHVLVIGGGDTGSDCVGTAIRQKARSVKQIEILPKPAAERADNNPWPYWPNTLRTSSSHLEGCERRWGLSTKRFLGENNEIKQVVLVGVEWSKDEAGRWVMTEKVGSLEICDADLVLLSMGFTQPVHNGLLDALGVEYDVRGNVKVNAKKQTSVERIFACGDVEAGASLVVRAIEAGKIAAAQVDEFLSVD
ncbi:MAG: glutamate synthase subunit beta [Prolixibacteraceae bacterium]|nr:glutamate synthase subunit beta [Prolixibacteraceae bacterium]